MIAEAELEVSLTPSEGRRPAPIRLVNPLQDAEWDLLLATRPDAHFFHGKGWTRVLHETYGHVPVYVSRVEAGRLAGLLPLMEVSSPLTGRRGVSLPFTDYCFPLTTDGQESADLYRAALAHGRAAGWRYLECRNNDGGWPGSSTSLSFYGHELDLEIGEDALFKNLDGSMRQGIRKAQSAGLRVEIGNTPDTIRAYFDLHCRTRRRHGLPPQPFRFFANIQRCLLQPGAGFVALARCENKPVAAAVFLHHGGQALYKYGASDIRFQHLRPNNLLMWEGIRQCAARGCSSLHFGRTSMANEGLRRFKLALGARETRINYCKFDLRKEEFVTDVDRVEGWFNRVFALMPPSMLRLAGKLLYAHLS